MTHYTPDYYAKKAKHNQFVARSVYKLEEIQKKFHVFNGKSPKILDLGSAPGSWTQYVLRTLPHATLVSVDINLLEKSVMNLCTQNNATFIQGDFTDQDTVDAILECGPYDCIISDAAPSTTGNRTVDTSQSEALVEMVLEIAKKALKKQGCFVSKIFQGSNIRELTLSIAQYFEKVKRYTPRAVKQKSFEEYLIGRNAKGIDNM